MLGVIGMVLTAIGTILAIVHPTIAARFGDEDTIKREHRLQTRYYLGISFIVIGTLMQVVQYLLYN
jgi:hypothetical protein